MKWATVGLLGALAVPLAAAADEQQCLAEAMYYEARDQGWRGMLAVGVVVQNRVRDWHRLRRGETGAVLAR